MGKFKIISKLGKKIRLDLSPERNYKSLDGGGVGRTQKGTPADTIDYSDLSTYLKRVKKPQIGVRGRWSLKGQNTEDTMRGSYTQSAGILHYKHSRAKNLSKRDWRDLSRYNDAVDNMPWIGGDYVDALVTTKNQLPWYSMLNVNANRSFTGGLGDAKKILKTIKKVAPQIKIVRFTGPDGPRDIIIRRLKNK